MQWSGARVEESGFDAGGGPLVEETRVAQQANEGTGHVRIGVTLSRKILA